MIKGKAKRLHVIINYNIIYIQEGKFGSLKIKYYNTLIECTYSGKAMCDGGHGHSTGTDGNVRFETTARGVWFRYSDGHRLTTDS